MKVRLGSAREDGGYRTNCQRIVGPFIWSTVYSNQQVSKTNMTGVLLLGHVVVSFRMQLFCRFMRAVAEMPGATPIFGDMQVFSCAVSCVSTTSAQCCNTDIDVRSHEFGA
jgi:hypothetical protein